MRRASRSPTQVDEESTPAKKKAIKDEPAQSPAQPKAQPVPTPKKATNLAKECDISEKVHLSCEQMAKGLETDSTCSSVTVKACQALLAKLTARMTPELRSLYSSDYGGSASSFSRGMKVLEQLESKKREMDLVLRFVTCLTAAPDSSDSSAEALREAAAKLAEGGVAVSRRYIDTLVTRSFNEAKQRGDFAACVGTFEDGEGSRSVDIHKLGADEVRDLQTSIVVHAVVDYLKWTLAVNDGRPDDDAFRKHKESLSSFIGAFLQKPGQVRDANLLADMLALQKVVSAGHDSDEALVLAADGAAKDLASNKKSPLGRPFALMPFGQQLARDLATLSKTAVADRGLAVDLNDLEKEFGKLDMAKCVAIESQEGLRITLVGEGLWMDNYKCLSHIEASGSTSFQSKHKEQLDKLASRLSEARQHIFSTALDKYMSGIEGVAAIMMGEAEGGTADRMEEALAKADSCMPSLEHTPLHGLSSAGMQKAFDILCGECKLLADALKSPSHWLFDDTDNEVDIDMCEPLLKAAAFGEVGGAGRSTSLNSESRSIALPLASI